MNSTPIPPPVSRASIDRAPENRAPVDRAAVNRAPVNRAREKWILAATIIASTMAFSDMTIVNVALPVLQKSLGASFAEVQWVVDTTGPDCSDAEDNSLAGTITKGEAFTTGHRFPPAHAGCRCLIVPVAVHVRAGTSIGANGG